MFAFPLFHLKIVCLWLVGGLVWFGLQFIPVAVLLLLNFVGRGRQDHLRSPGCCLELCPKASWRGKGYFDLYFHIIVHH